MSIRHIEIEEDIDERERLAIVGAQGRKVSPRTMRKFERYMGEIFQTLGLNIDTPATRDTPRRFVQALFDATEGYDGDPKLVRVFETECRGGANCHTAQVIEGPIPFFALCEHHALPFYGNAYLGYIAHEHIIGISKLTRIVRLFAKRFTVQERLTHQVADCLHDLLDPHGVAVCVQAHHMCMQMRGVRELASTTRTVAWRGAYADDPVLRSEFLGSCGLQRP